MHAGGSPETGHFIGVAISKVLYNLRAGSFRDKQDEGLVLIGGWLFQPEEGVRSSVYSDRSAYAHNRLDQSCI